MPIEWAGLSPELLLQLDRSSGEPLRTQLECELRQAIRTGRLQAGERLPSSRSLAQALGVSRGLVQECYGQLVAEGYLASRGGSATRVAAAGLISTPPAAPKPPGNSAMITEFRTGVPDLSSFPRLDWQWATREVARHMPTSALDYGPPSGSLVLREVLSGYLRRVRGAAAPAEQIVVCGGFAQGLRLVLAALARQGIRRVAYEDPGYDDAAEMAASVAGVETIPVPVDELGVDVDALAASGAKAILVTPAHQWPTGVVMAPHRRQALVAWANASNGYLIEDDYDAEFRYDREPVGLLQGLAPDRVLAIGTVSKSLAPGIRLGWVLCPPSLFADVATEKVMADRGSSIVDQLTVAKLMESGRFDRHLRRMRGVYGERRNVLAAALAEHAPAVRLTGLAAGFHAVAHLPSGLNEADVIAAARERGIGLRGMSQHRFSRSATPPQLVLGFGNLTERVIRQGIAAIGPILQMPGGSGA